MQFPPPIDLEEIHQHFHHIYCERRYLKLSLQLFWFWLYQGLIRFAPVWGDYIREFFLSSIADGISYVEARIGFFYKYVVSSRKLHILSTTYYLSYRYMYGADGQENIPHREWVRIFEEVMNEVKDEMTKQGRGDEFIGARVWIIQLSCHAMLKWSPSDYLFHH